MFKKDMTNVPMGLHGKICSLLERTQNRERVHVAYGSMLEGDESIFAVIARDRDAADEKCYSVLCYDPEVGDLYREKSGLTYADALIEMGERIKE